MAYTPGKRVTIPPKEYDGKSYDMWAEIADLASPSDTPIDESKGFNEIRDSQEPHAQYLASLYLQTSYEDYCRGASTRSIIDSSTSKDLAEKADQTWKSLRVALASELNGMIQVMEMSAPQTNPNTIRNLQFLCKPYINPDDAFNEQLVLLSGITLRSILQIASFSDLETNGRMIVGDLIKIITRRFSHHLRREIHVWMNIHDVIESGEPYPESFREDMKKNKMDIEKFQEIIEDDNRAFTATTWEPSIQHIHRHGLHTRIGDANRRDLAELFHKQISTPFGIMAYNCVMFMIELNWLSLEVGDFEKTRDIFGLDDDDVKTQPTYPSVVNLTDQFYRHVESICPNPNPDPKKNNHPLFTYFQEARDRWSYVEPEPHIFEHKKDMNDISLRIPDVPNWDQSEGTWSVDDTIFANDREDSSNRQRGIVRARGYLTTSRKELRMSGVNPDKPGGGYKILQRIVSKGDEYFLLGSPAVPGAPNHHNEAHWYDLSRKPQTVGRRRGVVNKESIDALNHLQNTQWEINLHLLNAIAECTGTDASDNPITLEQMLETDNFEGLRHIDNINLRIVENEFSQLKKKQLEPLLKERDLSTGGDRSDMITRLYEYELGSIPISELKSRLEEYGLNTDGEKDDLITRLVEYVEIIPPDLEEAKELHREWMNTYFGQKGEDAWVRKIISLNENVFWHVWACDWRGRLIPRCALLSPQGADMDRGLLRFKEWKPLGEKGWHYLKVYLFNLMKRDIFTEKQLEGYEKKCTFKKRDEFIEKHIAKFCEIADDPITHQKKWQKPPGTKVESMQILAAILEVVRIYRIANNPQKPIPYPKIESGLPIALDASNNGYQHLATLLGKRNLAEAVNIILPDGDEDKGEHDLYTRVADEAKDLNRCDFSTLEDNTGKPYAEWSDSKKNKLEFGIYSRDFAKPITMTIAYGAKDLPGNFNGNKNGKPKFKIARFIYCGDEEGGHPLVCYEGECEKEFTSMKDFMNHIDTHYDPDKYFLEQIFKDDIPDTNVEEDGSVSRFLIPIYRSDDDETKRDNHIRNLNSGKNKLSKNGPRGNKNNPYKSLSFDAKDSVPWSPKNKGDGDEPAERIFYIEDDWIYSYPRTCYEDILTKYQKIDKTIRSIEKNYGTMERNLKECNEILEDMDSRLEPQDQLNYLKAQVIKLEQQRNDSIRESCTKHGSHYPTIRRPVWHNSSKLYRLFKEQEIKIPSDQDQALIARQIASSFKEAIEKVSGNAFDSVEKALKKIVAKSTPLNLAIWTTPSGFRIRNYYPAKDFVRWGGTHGGVYTAYWNPQEDSEEFEEFNIENIFRDILKLSDKGKGSEFLDDLIRSTLGVAKDPVKLQNLLLSLRIDKAHLDEYCEKPFTRIYDDKPLYSQFLAMFAEDYSDNCRSLLYELVQRLYDLDPYDSERMNNDDFMNFPVFLRLRRKLIIKTSVNPKRLLSTLLKDGNVNHESSKGMQRGITPNFIHSLDGSHMTKVINAMCDEGTSDFWAVHDCFGVHPADTERLVNTIRKTFVEVHTKEDGETHKTLADWLDEIYPDWTQISDPLPESEFDILEVLQSKYIIS